MMTVLVLNFHHRSPEMYRMSPWVGLLLHTFSLERSFVAVEFLKRVKVGYVWAPHGNTIERSMLGGDATSCLFIV